jgi:hypothetical protein
MVAAQVQQRRTTAKRREDERGELGQKHPDVYDIGLEGLQRATKVEPGRGIRHGEHPARPSGAAEAAEIRLEREVRGAARGAAGEDPDIVAPAFQALAKLDVDPFGAAGRIAEIAENEDAQIPSNRN